MKKIIILITVALLSGCVVGQKTSFEGVQNFEDHFDPGSEILIAFIDQRPYVLSGNKAPTFTGLLRSLYGIPYPTHTKTGEPMGKELAMMFSRSMRAKGYQSDSLYIQEESNIKSDISDHTKAGWDTILFDLDEWKHDIGPSGSGRFIYNFNVRVFDSSANMTATESTKGEVVINGKYPLAAAIRDVVKEVLQRDSIRIAVNLDAQFQNENSEPDEGVSETKVNQSNTNCSVSQILSMKDNGLSENQISAACGKL